MAGIFTGHVFLLFSGFFFFFAVLHIFGRHAAVCFLESFSKYVLICKADLIAQVFDNSISGLQKLCCFLNPKIIDVLEKTFAGFLFEKPAQIFFIQMNVLGQILKRYFLTVVFIDIMEDLKDLFFYGWADTCA